MKDKRNYRREYSDFRDKRWIPVGWIILCAVFFAYQYLKIEFGFF